jgi:hypothetical protein
VTVALVVTVVRVMTGVTEPVSPHFYSSFL